MPTGSGRAGNARSDLDIQRILLGDVLLQSGDRFPVTSALNNLKGQFFVDYNLLSAGSVLSPCRRSSSSLLQKQFVSGLTLGPRRASQPCVEWRRCHEGAPRAPAPEQPRATRSASINSTSGPDVCTYPGNDLTHGGPGRKDLGNAHLR